MLNLSIQNEILDLLRSGLSQADVRRCTGVSRNAIRRISNLPVTCEADSSRSNKKQYTVTVSFPGESYCSNSEESTDLYSREQSIEDAADQLEDASDFNQNDSDAELETQTVYRCPTCGALVNQFPCLFCSLVNSQATEKNAQKNEDYNEDYEAPFIDPFGDLTPADALFGVILQANRLQSDPIELCKLELKPEHQVRYEQIRNRKLNSTSYR